jgi:hypothetical protein
MNYLINAPVPFLVTNALYRNPQIQAYIVGTSVIYVVTRMMSVEKIFTIE